MGLGVDDGGLALDGQVDNIVVERIAANAPWVTRTHVRVIRKLDLRRAAAAAAHLPSIGQRFPR